MVVVLIKDLIEIKELEMLRRMQERDIKDVMVRMRLEEDLAVR